MACKAKPRAPAPRGLSGDGAAEEGGEGDAEAAAAAADANEVLPSGIMYNMLYSLIDFRELPNKWVGAGVGVVRLEG